MHSENGKIYVGIITNVLVIFGLFVTELHILPLIDDRISFSIDFHKKNYVH